MRERKRFRLGLTGAGLLMCGGLLFGGAGGDAAGPHVVAGDAISAGRFLVDFGACNECHTPGYTAANGQIPDAQRLSGNPVGFQGPWGTSYAINLRLFFTKVPEERWIAFVRNPPFQVHPPMPWRNLQLLSDSDLHNIYAYVNNLAKDGPVGPPVPGFIPRVNPSRVKSSE